MDTQSYGQVEGKEEQHLVSKSTHLFDQWMSEAISVKTATSPVEHQNQKWPRRMQKLLLVIGLSRWNVVRSQPWRILLPFPEDLPEKADTTDEESHEPAAQSSAAILDDLAARGQRAYQKGYAIRRRPKRSGDIELYGGSLDP